LIYLELKSTISFFCNCSIKARYITKRQIQRR